MGSFVSGGAIVDCLSPEPFGSRSAPGSEDVEELVLDKSDVTDKDLGFVGALCKAEGGGCRGLEAGLKDL